MTVSDGAQATQLTRCHPGSLSHPVFLFLAQPHDDVQVPRFSSIFGRVRVRFRPGRVGVLPKKSNRIFCSANRISFFGSIRWIAITRGMLVLATRCIVMSKKTTENFSLCNYSTITWPIPIADREARKLNFFCFLVCWP